MTWSWRYEDAEGKPVEGPNETFSNQADAESWLGQTWRDLVAAGAVEVVLVEVVPSTATATTVCAPSAAPGSASADPTP
ncbi:hypothetical protein [Catellatospora sp. NPDC049609]|uniref:hypothetical protein n=1 Tax=Catellatospora sp. NPDC049609 TaxID=3155505 RepID=UPI00343A24AC